MLPRRIVVAILTSLITLNVLSKLAGYIWLDRVAGSGANALGKCELQHYGLSFYVKLFCA